MKTVETLIVLVIIVILIGIFWPRLTSKTKVNVHQEEVPLVELLADAFKDQGGGVYQVELDPFGRLNYSDCQELFGRAIAVFARKHANLRVLGFASVGQVTHLDPKVFLLFTESLSEKTP